MSSIISFTSLIPRDALFHAIAYVNHIFQNINVATNFLRPSDTIIAVFKDHSMTFIIIFETSVLKMILTSIVYIQCL